MKEPIARSPARRRHRTGSLHARTGVLPGSFVRDNGASFEMSRADWLFNPFTRLHQPSELKGSGIGLATVRRIIEPHGAQIRDECKTCEGAMFGLSFGSDAS